ncbi:MAG: prolyl-tRNA synthetase, partial [Candidatus Taylorbacteria bacterium CG10_big_fil_rev_8_21_14_0_10_41_48]
QLLIRAGFIHKEMAGVYSLLPLGLRVVNRINNVIRDEMNSIGGQELIMSALQNPEIWKASDRWEQDVWFKTALSVGGEVGFGWTQEEAITRIASHYVNSYRDLPFYAYQIQTKFRNEERAKSGILRGREFLMKDLYSFHETQEDLDLFYEKAKGAYVNVFNRVGLGEYTFPTFASGGAFSKYSHEFQTISDAGEDIVYVSRDKGIAINDEVMMDEVLEDLGLSKDKLEKHSAIEVGNIFKLGTRFSEALNLYYKEEGGKDKPVVMGSYGIGPTRLMGTIVEVLSDDKGIVWPKEVAPFSIHLISLGTSEEVNTESDRIYEILKENNIEVLYDDRGVRAGEKFADSDLIGIPSRVVVSEKTISEGGVELIDRKDGGVQFVPESEIEERLMN